jgi:hypothetical protein
MTCPLETGWCNISYNIFSLSPLSFSGILLFKLSNVLIITVEIFVADSVLNDSIKNVEIFIIFGRDELFILLEEIELILIVVEVVLDFIL